MDILIDWIEQIIVFILLATIVDLIVPANAMKKYVKLVIGLILILIFLRPVFFLFDINIQQSLETSVSELSEETSEKENMKKSIKMQKREIEDSQDAYILEEMAVQLKDQAKDPLAEKYQAEISNIDFEFSDEQNMTYEDLEEVIVYLREGDGDGEGEVSTVDDVVINMDKPAGNEKEDQDVEEIASLLKDIWELKDKELTIIWEGGAS